MVKLLLYYHAYKYSTYMWKNAWFGRNLYIALSRILKILVFELQVHPFHIHIIDPFLSSLRTYGYRYECINFVKDLLNHEFTEIGILSHGILISDLIFL